ncbi:MAG: plastocyanin/azurin family copper-binding protein [Xanthobacteraceae bacterium]|jgi:plastocyanin
MKPMTIVLALAFAGGAVAAFAAERSIMQKGKTFSASAVTIKKGDSLMFVNDDTIAHNILSTAPGNEFNLGSQAPGVSTPVTFKKSGEVAVLCAIHPRMKLMVTVTE